MFFCCCRDNDIVARLLKCFFRHTYGNIMDERMRCVHLASESYGRQGSGGADRVNKVHHELITVEAGVHGVQYIIQSIFGCWLSF